MGGVSSSAVAVMRLAWPSFGGCTSRRPRDWRNRSPANGFTATSRPASARMASLKKARSAGIVPSRFPARRYSRTTSSSIARIGRSP
jgi:hypothetical protein